MKSIPTREFILEILAEVKDPELPVIDIVELGIVRDVELDGDALRIDVTPTYSGCPAMEMIEREIRETLAAHGFDKVIMRTVFSPPWTTDWISDDTKRKLKEYGIAPPVGLSGGGTAGDLVTIRHARPLIECPYCGSRNTEEKSEFGSTACKAIHYCENCRQPFDYFKTF